MGECTIGSYRHAFDALLSNFLAYSYEQSFPMKKAEQPSGDESQCMAALARGLAPQEGYNLTALPGVRILRSDRTLSRTPVLYDPGIVIVCQGRKRGYFGDQIYLYDE